MASPLPNEIDLENAPSVTALKEKVKHRILRAMWLRAAILGANDGLLSTASLMLGIGAASSDKEAMIISGIAGGLAGACSMAVGEFVSVSTQRDIEKTMVEKCVAHVKLQGKLGESISLQAHSTQSTVEESNLEATSAKPAIPNSPTCVLSPSRSSTMKCIASEARLTALQEDKSELDALPNPYKAAAASALSFLCGAFIPIVSTIAISSSKIRFIIIAVVTSISLAGFSGIGAFLGGSPVRVSAMRAVFGGWISMSISYGLLKAFDGADHDHDSTN